MDSKPQEDSLSPSQIQMKETLEEKLFWVTEDLDQRLVQMWHQDFSSQLGDNI